MAAASKWAKLWNMPWYLASEAAGPPSTVTPGSMLDSSSISLPDAGMALRYLPGTAEPAMMRLRSVLGSVTPRRHCSTVKYVASAPASRAAPKAALICGEMYGGTPRQAGSSTKPSIISAFRTLAIDRSKSGGVYQLGPCDHPCVRFYAFQGSSVRYEGQDSNILYDNRTG